MNKEKQPLLHIYFVCDAGMGSSALGAGLLQKKMRNYQLSEVVKNCAIHEIDSHVDILVSHQSYTKQLQKAFPHAICYGITEFMDDSAYERIVQEIMFLKKKKEEKGILQKANIKCNCHANNSDEAIIAMGELLQEAGYIEKEYIQGMLNRDHDLTTYIGNDIAIPHGEYDVKDYVLQTGIAVMIYPEGIPWADGKARIVIGIAAKNDDHMTILANIADVLGEMEVVEQVVHGDIDTIYKILTKEA